MSDQHKSEITAILVDGGFYLRRARRIFGDKTPKKRADELYDYCLRHLKGTDGESSNHLYRIFYYDCKPIGTNLYHPLTKQSINMSKTDTYEWANQFFDELASKRKLALRFGDLQERESAFRIKDKSMRKLCRGEMEVSDLSEDDFELDLIQKGVDMRIALDIASMAHQGIVTQMVLISGDSDFVPAAKHARRAGIDFILDPMWQKIRPELSVHIDGLHSCVKKNPRPGEEPLCVRNE